MHPGQFPKVRLRRLRQHASIRDLIREVYLSKEKLILPLFIKEGAGIKHPIASMPSHFQLSLDQLEDEIKNIVALGIKSVLLFGIPKDKDARGQVACHDHGIIQQAIPLIKKLAPQLLVISDICFCEYTDHGHCGVLTENEFNRESIVDNDQTLTLLALQAVSHAKAGADVIAPSATMDGMVQAIRFALDQAGFSHVPILSYAVKYASSLYGPFRQAAEGAPQFGDRRSYQMDFSNTEEAIRECMLDVEEGVDCLMVKPAHAYLDVIYQVKRAFPAIPLGAYHTSGEYAMLKAAAQQGWIDEQKSVFEILTAIHRAGADFIITYYAKEVAAWLDAKPC